jgi:hypothetical protein
MTSVLREFSLSYAVVSESRRCGSAPAVHESSLAGPAYRASSIAPAGPSAGATPPRRSPESSTPRVRLHLKPGQNGTKQLLAQYGDRLICVRFRSDAQRKRRLKTVELLVAERDWEPPRLGSPHMASFRSNDEFFDAVGELLVTLDAKRPWTNPLLQPDLILAYARRAKAQARACGRSRWRRRNDSEIRLNASAANVNARCGASGMMWSSLPFSRAWRSSE